MDSSAPGVGVKEPHPERRSRTNATWELNRGDFWPLHCACMLNYDWWMPWAVRLHLACLEWLLARILCDSVITRGKVSMLCFMQLAATKMVLLCRYI